MDITLIDYSVGVMSLGIRTLASYPKQHGHHVRMIFLPGDVEEMHLGRNYVYKVPPEVIDGIAEVCSRSQLVGLSLMSNYFDQSCQITQELGQRVDVPVIWGGIHPTVKPEECLEHADMVCIGEGEEALLELADRMDAGQDVTHVANIWSKRNGEVVRNAARPAIHDLDAIPPPDYSFEDHYAFDRKTGRIVPLTLGNVPDFLDQDDSPLADGQSSYSTMMSRGCPYACSYCCNNAYVKMYPNWHRIRRRSVDHVIAELRDVTTRIPAVRYVRFFDDEFYGASRARIREFAEKYKRAIGLPFFCFIGPAHFDDEKTQVLADAGLIKVEMGVQSAAPKTMELYGRRYKVEQLHRACHGMSQYSDRVIVDYDIILDNPFEATEDLMETFRFMLDVPEPHILRMFSLTFFPGTDLYRMAGERGLIDDDRDVRRKQYHSLGFTYPNLLFRLLCYKFPRPLLRLMSHPKVVKALDCRAVGVLVQATAAVLRRTKIAEPLKWIGPLRKVRNWRGARTWSRKALPAG